MNEVDPNLRERRMGFISAPQAGTTKRRRMGFISSLFWLRSESPRPHLSAILRLSVQQRWTINS